MRLLLHRTSRLSSLRLTRADPNQIVLRIDPDPGMRRRCSQGISRTTSAGSLSRRRPWNRGWRSCPAVVHSVKPTWATSRGSTQCTPDRGRLPRSNGGSGPAPAGQRRVQAGPASAGRSRCPPCPRRRACRRGRSSRAAARRTRCGSPRVGEAADDELLAVLALELQPVPGPPGPVGRVGPLGDDPFPALAAGLPPSTLRRRCPGAR